MVDIANIKKHLQGFSIDKVVPISGGNICHAFRVESNNQRWCLKIRHDAPSDFFYAEHNGLKALSAGNEVRVPSVVSAHPSFILLEWLQPQSCRPKDMIALGNQLASLHSRPVSNFGFFQNNYCGLMLQDNTRHKDGHEFFAFKRLIIQGKMAHDAKLLDLHDRLRIERLAENLRRWIPEQPPSMIHGDLWSGNILYSTDGPALIDPAVHHGWAEADLAMTCLFGTMGPSFYDAYRENRPLDPGFKERVPIYNLYHLLNHLNLFGIGWSPSVKAVLDRFV